MNIESYTFKSPYPNQVQIGNPLPKTETAQTVEEPKSEILQTQKKTEGESGIESLPQLNATNVASATTDTSLSGSLSEFSRVSSQLQAAQAYSN